MKRANLCFCVSLFLLACHKEEATPPAVNPPLIIPKNPGPNYYVINNDAPIIGNITKIDSEGTSTNLLSADASFADAVIDGDKMYCITIDNKLYVYDLLQSKLVKSISLGYSTGNYKKHIASANNRVFISDCGFPHNRIELNYQTFIKVINLDNDKLDSIHISQNGVLGCMAAANGKIFIATTSDNLNQILMGFDLQTYSKIHQDTLGHGSILDMIVDKESNLLVYTGLNLLKLNSSDLSIIQKDTVYGSQINFNFDGQTSNSNACAFDEEASTLYFIAPAAGGLVETLYSHNMTTNATMPVGNTFKSGATISFNPTKKLILLANNSTVSVYDTAGNLKSKSSVTNLISEVIVH